MSLQCLKHNTRQSVASLRCISSITKRETPSKLFPEKRMHPSHLKGTRNIIRRFSENGIPSELEQAVAEQQMIIRHSKADSVVSLNVGGKDFVTLRSTLQINPVLYDRVLRAEANNELIKGAVFVDRDPTHFGSILQHLRNVADSITLSSAKNRNAWLNRFSSPRTEVNIQIPGDTAKLRELFIEARYFKIKELEDVVSGYDWWSWLASLLNGGATNPFHSALQAVKIARRTLLTTGGLGILIGAQNEALWSEVTAAAKTAYAWITSRAPSIESGWFSSSADQDPEPKPKMSWFGRAE
ncbi:unnamed protein product [Cylindrotheca closterium]|uniref:BTB domain-containing protein n=1 Tax=Cylindrotheca closterium TaxID=2856 RepID=A0AAD2CIH4_9STRA|nr:unnamed protein product [Cylindrotheca closterium]